MKTYHYETQTHVLARRLFATIADIAHWPDWDGDLEFTEHDGDLRPGARFVLKPKDGPKVVMEIAEASAPIRFIDIAHLPLAKMRTSHFFEESGARTTVRVGIEIWGALGFLWDRLVARKLAAGFEEDTRRLINYAKTRDE